jgi:hypothetical protein
MLNIELEERPTAKKLLLDKWFKTIAPDEDKNDLEKRLK